MPSFGLLEDKDKEQLISYVIHLSLRGEVELNIMSSILKKEAMDASISDTAKDLAGTFLKKWFDSNQKAIEPSEYPYQDGDEEQLKASVRRGYELFTDPKGPAVALAVIWTSAGKRHFVTTIGVLSFGPPT